jgi:hypothetical protein
MDIMMNIFLAIMVFGFGSLLFLPLLWFWEDVKRDRVLTNELKDYLRAMACDSTQSKGYADGAIDAISAIVLDEKDLPEGFEKVKIVQMKKAKEFLKDL